MTKFSFVTSVPCRNRSACTRTNEPFGHHVSQFGRKFSIKEKGKDDVPIMRNDIKAGFTLGLSRKLSAPKLDINFSISVDFTQHNPPTASYVTRGYQHPTIGQSLLLSLPQ
jgi:hypothetical protein